MKSESLSSSFYKWSGLKRVECIKIQVHYYAFVSHKTIHTGTDNTVFQQTFQREKGNKLYKNTICTKTAPKTVGHTVKYEVQLCHSPEYSFKLTVSFSVNCWNSWMYVKKKKTKLKVVIHSHATLTI